ncbi:polysaccharide deacetylase family protein [Kordiimonas pumila]|uniref:Chitooligosaccharide deacetylase n=1 Tax=Kordiimonas pumila TaxID=2161677 RepID=A0ABV7D0G4_9PROT|nr:polysaccharide deacetylase family protein [Kordiimonas pumila]
MKQTLGYIHNILLATLSLLFMAQTAVADPSAIVLLYHRFGEDEYPSTNIRLEQLENHIRLLKQGGYHFMSLSDAAQHIQNRQDFPARTIVITVDDAYKSVFDKGWPLLKAAGIPMTLFVSTDPIDEEHSNYMTWDSIRAIKADGVEIGHHSASHLHMVHDGVEASKADIARASKRFREELGSVPALFAYPYGEYSTAMKEMIKDAGFTAAFAQFSGPIAAHEDMYALPRFPVNERYGDEGRFKLITEAIALPVSDIVPSGSLVPTDRNPPVFGFTVDPSVKGLSALSCYPSHLGEPATLLRPQPNRVEVRFTEPFPKGRNRINCTMPAGAGRWYWFGRFFMVPGGDRD